MREMEFQVELSPEGIVARPLRATVADAAGGGELDAAALGRAVLHAAQERRMRALRRSDALWDYSTPVGLFSDRSMPDAERSSREKTGQRPVPQRMPQIAAQRAPSTIRDDGGRA